MAAACSSETSVNFCETTWHQISEDSTPHRYGHENSNPTSRFQFPFGLPSLHVEAKHVGKNYHFQAQVFFRIRIMLNGREHYLHILFNIVYVMTVKAEELKMM
jgi:hypothetical protein